ncbi:MAG TPA: hypothetical protein PK620_13395 [Denitromonas sp.]|nr:hypothetical protein [Zoogloeaceae bacterium]HQV15908.1 hypothetical protein [Denitromonas sp.]
MTETCTRKDFAARMGWRSQGQVSNLIKDGLIALTDDGKLVKVAESIAAIEAARDPSKAGVRARHAAEREQGGAGHEKEEDSFGNSYQAARTVKERYAALKEKLAYEVSIGKYMLAAEAAEAVADGDTMIRGRLETLPDILAPRLSATSDEEQIKSILRDEIETILEGISRAFWTKKNGTET